MRVREWSAKAQKGAAKEVIPGGNWRRMTEIEGAVSLRACGKDGANGDGEHREGAGRKRRMRWGHRAGSSRHDNRRLLVGVHCGARAPER